MAERKLITISVPPQLLDKAERLAVQENRSKSELVREALRLYIDTSEVRRRTTREQLAPLLDRVQSRTRAVPSLEIRRLIREAVRAARRPAPPVKA
ncbi:MAG: ribbon-helix-helix domain-containing protein [Candidatus Methylomirabilota bacterium]